MDELTITIERRLNGQLLRCKSTISAQAIDSEKEPDRLIQYLTANLWKQFSSEYDMERENIRYAPKPTENIFDKAFTGYNTRGGI